MVDRDSPAPSRPEGVENNDNYARHGSTYITVQRQEGCNQTESTSITSLNKPDQDSAFRQRQGEGSPSTERQTEDPHGTAAVALAVLSSGVASSSGGNATAAPSFSSTSRTSSEEVVNGQREEVLSQGETTKDDGLVFDIKTEIFSGDDTILTKSSSLSEHRHRHKNQQEQQESQKFHSEQRASITKERSSSSSFFVSNSPELQGFKEQRSLSLKTDAQQLPRPTLPRPPLSVTTAIPPESSIKQRTLSEQVDEHDPQFSGVRMHTLSHELRHRLSIASGNRDREMYDLVSAPPASGVAQYQDRGSDRKEREVNDLDLRRSGSGGIGHDGRDGGGVHARSEYLTGGASPAQIGPIYQSDDDRPPCQEKLDFSMGPHVHYNHRHHPHQYSPQRRQPLGGSTSLQEYSEYPRSSVHDIRQHDPPPRYSSPTMESVVKPKRKYTKKSMITSTSYHFTFPEMSGSYSSRGETGGGEIPFRPELNDPHHLLMQTDRGLVLKTQIPKKGRPISKHPSSVSSSSSAAATSSSSAAAFQSVPTLSSIEVLPASHPYFSTGHANATTAVGTTGIPYPAPSSPLSSSVGRLPDLRPGSLPVSTGQDDHHQQYHRHNNHHHPSQIDPAPSQKRFQTLNTAVHRKPGRPPLAAAVAIHAHSQSHYSSLYLTRSNQDTTTTGIMHSQPQPALSQAHHHLLQYNGATESNGGEISPTTSAGPFKHYRDSSPISATSSSSTKASTRGVPTKRHSYPIMTESQRRHQESNHQQQHDQNYLHQHQQHRRSPNAIVDSPTEMEDQHQHPQQSHYHHNRCSRDQSPQEYDRHFSAGSEVMPSFAEGYPPLRPSSAGSSVGRKRSSSGATKSRGYSDSGFSGGGSTDFDNRRHDERSLSGRYFGPSEEMIQPPVEGARARKRISRPEVGNLYQDEYRNWQEGEEDVSSVIRSSTWNAFPVERRGRPRSTTALQPPVRAKQIHPNYDTHAGSEQHDLEFNQRGQRREYEDRHRGGRVSHGHGHGHNHARSLDLSFVMASQERQRIKYGEHMDERIGGCRGSAAGKSGTLPSPLVISPTFGHAGPEHLLSERSEQIYSGDRYHEFDSPLPPPSQPRTSSTTTTADRLTKEMAGSKPFESLYSLSGSMSDHPARLVAIEGNNNQGRRAAQGPVMKTTPKRSSKKGPGPHLKKHQILQQQLQQIQREQEELEIQHALHLRQQHHQKQAPKQRQQHHELVRTRYSPFSQRSQQLHKNVAQAQQQQQQHQYQDDRLHHAHHPYHPQQPQPGRPPKQRVLMRSESASSVLHGGQLSPQYPAPPQFHSHSNQQRSPHSSDLTNSNLPSTATAAPSLKRRQNQHQTILLRPVSLMLFSGSAVGGIADNTGSPMSINSSTSSTGRAGGGRPFYHSQGGPPPGQPLYRSLPALSPLSPNQIAPLVSATTTNVAAAAQEQEKGRDGGPNSLMITTKYPHGQFPPREVNTAALTSTSQDRNSNMHPSPRSSPSVSLSSPQSATGPNLGHTVSGGPFYPPRLSSPPFGSSRPEPFGHGTYAQQQEQGTPLSRPRISSTSTSSLSSHHSTPGSVAQSVSRSNSLSITARRNTEEVSTMNRGEMSASSSSNTLFHHDTDMSTSSSVTSLSSLSSLNTLSHRHSQSSLTTAASLSSSLSLAAATAATGENFAPQYQDRVLSPQHKEMVDIKSEDEPSANHWPMSQSSASTLMTKLGSAGSRPPLPPDHHPTRSSTPTPTPTSTPTPRLGPSMTVNLASYATINTTIEEPVVERLSINTLPDDV